MINSLNFFLFFTLYFIHVLGVNYLNKVFWLQLLVVAHKETYIEKSGKFRQILELLDFMQKVIKYKFEMISWINHNNLQDVFEIFFYINFKIWWIVLK